LQNGIISCYTVQLNPKAIGWNIHMLVGITMEHSRYHETFFKQVSALPFVSRCLYLTGELDFFLEIFAASPEELQKDHGQLSMMEGVSSVKTFYVLNVYEQPIPLPAPARHLDRHLDR
jgi:Lrp/AsnC family leucine-responsive transcriptional regulator